jgi:hypothetical protein
MNPAVRPTHPVLSLGRLPAACLLAALSAAALSGNEPDKKTEQPPPPAAPAGVEVHFNDGSVLKVMPRDERLEVATPYGKLTIPLADVRQIDFGTRIPDEVSKRIDRAVADLSDADFHKREAASATLLGLREKAYPALLEAAKQKDAEVVRRVEGLLERLRETVPEKDLEFRKHDVVQTADSKIAGHIAGEALKVQTVQFGEVDMKLADVRSLRSLAAAAQEVVARDVLPDPGSLTNYQNDIGKTLHFQVTGAVNVGTVWGTGVYTSDSPLATAAVHAGLLKAGQTGVVKVTIVPPLAAYMGSTQNGVTTSDYGPWPGAYRVSR